MNGRLWTGEEVAFLRAHYATQTGKWIGRRLGRSLSCVHQAARQRGLARKREPAPEALLSLIRDRHAAGWVDSEIMRAWNEANPERSVSRESVGNYRRALGLDSNKGNARYRQQVRERTAEQLRRAGVPRLVDLRVRANRREAIRSGWPHHLTPNEVQVLNLLADGMPRTRREIALELGKDPDPRNAFKTKRTGKSVTASLRYDGLLRRSQRRVRKDGGKGHTAYEFWIPLQVLQERNRKMGRRLVG